LVWLGQIVASNRHTRFVVATAWRSRLYPAVRAIIRWDVAIVTLDDEGGYDFVGRA
jgi:hypothetical protein